MLKSDAAAFLAGVTQVEGAAASAPTNLHVITGEVGTTSEEGKTTISIDGLVFSEEDSQEIEIDTLGGLEEGDIATVILTGESGHGMTPLAIGAPGSVDRLKARVVEAELLIADKADIEDLEAATARIGDLEADHVSVTTLEAATARIETLEVDHVSIADFEVEQANIDSLQAATADIDTIRANSAKVQNLTAAQLEADHATVGSLSTTYATIANLNAANGRITNLESTKANISDLEADYITADEIDATYMHADMSNSDVAWIQNGTIKNGAIVSAMINDVSANKLTAGTINGSVINVTNLNADNITAGTINGQRIGTGSLSLDKLSENVYTEAEVDTIVDGLNDRIDGAIETHTGTAVPTLNNSPASSWNTTALKDEHVGDVYYVVNSQSQQNGYCYRFTKSGSTYSWQLIKDSDVTAALSRLTTAEGKITSIESFDSTVSSFMTDTDDELTSIKSRATSLETRMTDAEGDISDKVDTSTFNTLSQTVDTNTASITSLSSTVSQKADGSTVTALTNRVSTVEQDVDGIETSIGELQETVESKADGSTVSTISNRLNTVSDTVDGHTQTLTSVQNTLSSKADSSTVSTLSTQVNTIEDTVDGHTSQLSSITSTQTTMQSTLDKTVKSSIQLWYSKANTTAPSKPTSKVTSTSTAGNAWRIVVPAYNASYPHYYYCWQYEYVDGTYGWSAVVRDIAMGESQSTARTADSNASAAVTTANTASTNASTALTTANTANTNASEAKTTATTASTTASEAKTTAETAASDASTAKTNAASAVSTANSASTTATNAQTTANANIKSSVQLWFTKANSTAPSKPTSVVSTSNANTANAWNLVVPVWNSSYPHYFYCYQQQKGDGTYQWTDVVYDRATSEAQQLANTTSTNLSTLQTDYATFKQTTEQFESTVGTTYATKTELRGATDDITELEGRVSTNETSISNNASAIALKANSSDVYTKSGVDGLISTEVANRNAAITAKANEITSSVSETYTTKQEFADLEIGGRNLLPSSVITAEGVDGSTKEFTLSTAVLRTKFGNGKFFWDNFEEGTQYTFSVSAIPNDLTVGSETTKGPIFYFRYEDGSSSNVSFKYKPDGIVRQTIISTAGKTVSKLDASYGNAYCLWTFYDLKLEKGNKATDWTPAPEDIETRVSSAESAITQNANAIALKVNSSDVYTKTQTDGLISTEVTNRNSAIEQSANEITSTVSQTYTTKEEFDNLEVGGRNLVLKTSESKTSAASASGSSFVTAWNMSDYGHGIMDNTDDVWTISFDYEVSGNEASEAYIYAQVRTTTISANVEDPNVPVLNNPSGRYSKRFKLTSAQASGTSTQVRMRLRYATDGATFTMSNLKLEKGNKATDWTPAPEDIETRVSSAESSITQNANNIALKVSESDVTGNYIVGKINLNSTTASIAAEHINLQGAVTISDLSSDAQSATLNSNISVGGRNYILSSAGTLVSGLGSAAGSRKEYKSLNVGQSYMDVPDGTEVTISFDLYMTVNTANPRLQVYNTNNKGPKQFMAVSKYFTAAVGDVINERVSLTSSICDRADSTLSDNFIEFYTYYDTSNWFSISNLKVEIGNVATDWTPAPEDATAYTDDAIDSIEVGGRNLLPMSDRLGASGTSSHGLSWSFGDDGWIALSGTIDTTTSFAPVFWGHTVSESAPDYTWPAGTYTFTLETTGTPLVYGLVRVQVYVESGANQYLDEAGTVTFTATNGIQRIGLYVNADANGETVNGALRYKLEKGNIATDWSPAPEDTPDQMTWYGTCSTAASTVEKVVACDGFELRTGARIAVKSTTANTANAPTLNVNGTGAIATWYNNAVSSTTNPIRWGANATLNFVYDGSVWVLDERPPSYSATCSTAASTRSKAPSVVGALVVNGTRLSVRFSTANTYTSNSVQLNLASTGAYSVYQNNAVTSTTNTLLWDANTILTFVAQGTYWHLLSRSDASETATSYVTEITGQNGIMVHPSTDQTTGVRITSDVDILRAGTSVINIGTNDAIRIGAADNVQMLIESDGLEIDNEVGDKIFGIESSSSGSTTVTAALVTWSAVADVDTTARTVSDSTTAAGEPIVTATVNGTDYTLESTHVTTTVTAGTGVTVALTSDGVAYVQGLMVIEVDEDDVETVVPCELSVEYQRAVTDVATLDFSGKQVIHGSGVGMLFTNDEWSSNNQVDTYFKAINDVTAKSIAFGVGAGGYNRGIWDDAAGSWLIQRTASDDTVINGPKFSVAASGNVKSTYQVRVTGNGTTAETQKRIALRSNNVANRGLFDESLNKWIMYRSLAGNDHLAGGKWYVDDPYNTSTNFKLGDPQRIMGSGSYNAGTSDTMGPYVTLTAGKWLVTGNWIFNNTSSSSKRLVVGFYRSTTSQAYTYRVHTTASSSSAHRLEVVDTITIDAASEMLTLYASSSPASTSAATQYIVAIRLT